jgi:hypothetical protein
VVPDLPEQPGRRLLVRLVDVIDSADRVPRG